MDASIAVTVQSGPKVLVAANLLDIGQDQAAVMGLSRTMGMVIPAGGKPSMKVVVFQLLCVRWPSDARRA